MLPYETYLHLMGELDGLVAALENHPDPSTREHALALLNGLDLLHREGIHRLVAALRERGAGPAVDEAAEEDPVVRTLLGLYDLAELGLPEAGGEEGDAGGAAAHQPRDEASPAPGAQPVFVPLERVTVRGKPILGSTGSGRRGEG